MVITGGCGADRDDVRQQAALHWNETHERRRATKKSKLMPIAPVTKHRPPNLMTPRHLGQRHVITMAFLDNPNLLVVRPTPTATRIGNRQNLNAGGVFVCVHKGTR